jgi:multiple antibiotic resistance protein
MSTHFVNHFITLLVVVDPVAVLPIFLALTSDCPPALKRKLAFQSILVAFVVMVFFIFLAQAIIEAIGLSLRSFQIAGGMILFLFATPLVLGSEPITPTGASDPTDYSGMAIYPLAIPSISGPGVMLTCLVIADDNRFSAIEQILTTFAGGLVLIVTLALLLLADRVYSVIGSGGTNVVRRVMGMVLAAFAVHMVLSGFAAWLDLPQI